jgi:hypothetical protein
MMLIAISGGGCRLRLDSRSRRGKRVDSDSRLEKGTNRWPLAAAIAFQLTALAGHHVRAQQKPEAAAAASCRVEPVNYMGWQAQQLSNPWVKLIFVPQNGGRLMQVIFDAHPFLFVNPRYAGKYLPPSGSEWFNYGGDKLWVLPEGNDNEKQWAGNSDVLDDSPFAFQILKQGPRCEISLTGPADPQTGLQFQRIVGLGADSPRISFHAVIKNSTGHPIEWSVQSVSQYNTADAKDPSRHNRNIWGFTKVNPASSYLNQYHVRFGPAENSAAQVRENGLFAVHYVPLAAELWIDSRDGWLAVVDGDTHYAMVERFRYDDTRPYPGKASVIFWTNGPELHQHADGATTFGSSEKDPPAIYMEAEVNSPMVRLEPGEEFSFDTQWYPTRADTDFQGVADSGVILKPLHAVKEAAGGKIKLTGSFGVLFPGKLVVHFYDAHGMAVGMQTLMQVDPKNPVILQTAINDPGQSARVSLHLEDAIGLDRGALGEVGVESSAPTP